MRNLFPLLLAACATMALRVSDAHASDADAWVVGSGCLGDTHQSFNELQALMRPLKDAGASLGLSASSPNALGRAGVYILPDAAAATTNWQNAAIARALLASKAEESVELIDDKLPVLVSAGNLFFQRSAPGRTAWLERMWQELQRTDPDARRQMVSGRLSRITRGTATAWRLEVPALQDDPAASTSLGHDPFAFDVRFVVRAALPDGVDLYGVGRAIGQNEFVKARLQQRPEQSLLFHLGAHLEPPQTGSTLNAVCVEALRALRFSAALPAEMTIQAGPDVVVAAHKAANMPAVMTTLRPQSEKGIPSFLLLQQGDRHIAVLGLYGEQMLRTQIGATSTAWRLVPLQAAVDEALLAIQSRLGRPPDLVVALSAFVDADESAFRTLSGVHVVMRTGSRRNNLDERSVLTVDGPLTPSRPLVRMDHPASAIGRLTAEWGERTLRQIAIEERPVLEEGPFDDAMLRALRAAGDADLLRETRVVLPDPEPFIRAHDVLHPYVWGPRIINTGDIEANREGDPPQITDPLWLTFVANTLRRELHVDAVILRNGHRHSDILGPVIQGIVDDWLGAVAEVQVVTLRGEALQRLLPLLAQHAPATANPDELVMTSGLNSERSRISGRSIEPMVPYRVAISTDAFDLPGWRAVIGAVEGEPVAVKNVVNQRLEASHRADGSLDPDVSAALLQDFLPNADPVEVRFSAGIEELSGNALMYRNSDNIATLAVTRETRATNPNLFQGGLKLNAFTLLDGPLLAWENRLRIQYDGVLLDIPNTPLNIRLNEQRDDVVLSSELRGNSIRLEFGDDGGFRVIPFAQGAFDSELTATPDPSKPNAWLTHQLLLRETLGVVLSPGAILQEVRAGFIVQHDLSEVLTSSPSVRHDAGITLAYKLSWPIVWRLMFQSELDARYLVPDPDDRVIDLSLRAQAVERLVLPLTSTLSMFTFVDAIALSGKTAVNRDLAYNVIVGGGVQFADIWR